MSSYVANSFYKQSPNIPAYNMQTCGNYGSASEVQASRYCYGGLDLSITFPPPAPSNSLHGVDMAANPRAHPDRPACSAAAAPGHALGRDEAAPLNPGMYSQKAARPALEERAKSSGEIDLSQLPGASSPRAGATLRPPASPSSSGVCLLCLKTAGARDQGVARMRTLGPLIESALSPLAGGRRPAAHPAVRDAAGAWGHPDPVRGRPPTRQGPSQSHRSALVPVTRTVHTHPSLGFAREGARTRSAQVHPSASSSGRAPR